MYTYTTNVQSVLHNNRTIASYHVNIVPILSAHTENSNGNVDNYKSQTAILLFSNQNSSFLVVHLSETIFIPAGLKFPIKFFKQWHSKYGTAFPVVVDEYIYQLNALISTRCGCNQIFGIQFERLVVGFDESSGEQREKFLQVNAWICLEIHQDFAIAQKAYTLYLHWQL